MDLKSITLKKYGVSMHLTPKNEEGYEYTAEEVYDMLKKPKDKEESDNRDSEKGTGSDPRIWDDHKRWKSGAGDYELRELWKKRVFDATSVMEKSEASTDCDKVPLMIKRLLKEMQNSQVNWREILNDFIQSEINDYSFSPPDRRFEDYDFFLPDYNEKDESVEKLWFLIDTSGSVSDKAIAAAFSEISGAIEQFGGKLEGMLSFFDANISNPVPFSSQAELLDIKPKGGGGTSFTDIFNYMKKNMLDDLPQHIIIITDGYDDFPSREMALGVPVLWLINNNEVTPPWGKVARIEVK